MRAFEIAILTSFIGTFEPQLCPGVQEWANAMALRTEEFGILINVVKGLRESFLFISS